MVSLLSFYKPATHKRNCHGNGLKDMEEVEGGAARAARSIAHGSQTANESRDASRPQPYRSWDTSASVSRAMRISSSVVTTQILMGESSMLMMRFMPMAPST